MRNKKNGPSMKDYALMKLAGIDPKTGLPTRAVVKPASFESVRNMLKVIDQQDAVNRFTWYNMPLNLSSQEIERMLYYKYQLVFFMLPGIEEGKERFFLMPFALDGTIDWYGRYNRVHPVPYSGGQDGNEEQSRRIKKFLSNIKIKVIWEMMEPEEFDPDEIYGVIIRDYTNGLGQNAIPRVYLNEGIIDAEAEIFPFIRTAMLTSSGVKGVKVSSADEAIGVSDASRAIHGAAMSGEAYIPIVAKLDVQELGSKAPASFQDYFLSLQSMENFRLASYGLDNGGLFQKKAHMLQDEEDVNGGSIGLVMSDGIENRQRACNIINSIWESLGVWCEVSGATMQIEEDEEESDQMNLDQENREERANA